MSDRCIICGILSGDYPYNKVNYSCCKQLRRELEAARAEVERLNGEVQESANLYRGERDDAVKLRADLAAAVKVLSEVMEDFRSVNILGYADSNVVKNARAFLKRMKAYKKEG